jgi:hypothetical protein
MIDKSEQGGGVRGMQMGFPFGIRCQLIQMQLCCGQLGLHGNRNTVEILRRRRRLAEQLSDLRIADGKGGRKREYAITEVFLSTPLRATPAP